jgi:hypothetical protein
LPVKARCRDTNCLTAQYYGLDCVNLEEATKTETKTYITGFDPISADFKTPERHDWVSSTEK